MPEEVLGHHRLGKWILIKERYRYYKRRYGNFFVFIMVTLLHLWLLNYSLDVRKINLWEAVTSIHKNDFDPLFIFNLVALAVLTIFSFKFRVTQPGYVQAVAYNSDESATNIIAKDMHPRGDMNALIRLDSVCFICLRVKGRHVEHCKRLGRCVEGLHEDKSGLVCIGQGNQRSYAIYIGCSFVLACTYLYQMVFLSKIAGGYNSTRSSNFLFRCVELHVKTALSLGPLLLPLIVAWALFLFSLDCMTKFWVAVSRGLTINELNNPWKYRNVLSQVTLDESRTYGHRHGPFGSFH